MNASTLTTSPVPELCGWNWFQFELWCAGTEDFYGEKKTREMDVTLQVYWSPLYQRTETGLRGTDETAQVTPAELAGTAGVCGLNSTWSNI